MLFSLGSRNTDGKKKIKIRCYVGPVLFWQS